MYSLKLELNLNNKEKTFFSECAGVSRFAYNFGLSLIFSSWNWKDIKASDSTKINAIKKVFTNDLMSQKNYSWLKKYPSTIHQSAFYNLATAFSRWRKGLSKKPVFKSKKTRKTFTVYKTAGKYLGKGLPIIPFTNRVVQQPGKKIKLPGLGQFKLKESIPFFCSSQSFRITNYADKWFVSFTIDAEKISSVIHEVDSVGIDLGVKAFATLSDGTTYSTPEGIKPAKTKLSKTQWWNRNKQLGSRKTGVSTSNNAKKYFKILSKIHSRIANIRKDFLQKTTTSISKKYYRIRIEDLNIAGMLANHKLANAIGNLGLYEFRRQLGYKQLFFGSKVELVDRWYPSTKTCCKCHHIQPMKLNDRVFACQNPKCGNVMDRDLNASINLEQAPEEKVRSARPELTPVDKKEPTPLVEAGNKHQQRFISDVV